MFTIVRKSFLRHSPVLKALVMTTLNFDDEEDDIRFSSEMIVQSPRQQAARLTEVQALTPSDSCCNTCPIANTSGLSLSRSDGHLGSAGLTSVQALQLQATSATNNMLQDLVSQSSDNTILLHKVLAELRDLREHMEKRWPFSVKTCGFERELVTKAKELFITFGPWLVHVSLDRLKEKIVNLLGGGAKADPYQVNMCVSHCKEKYTLWRAEVRKKVLNNRYNQLKISEFAEKLYNSFKTKEEDMRNTTKTALLLRKFAQQEGYLDETSKPDFWEKFVEFVNLWNNTGIPNKWMSLRAEDEDKYKGTLLPIS